MIKNLGSNYYVIEFETVHNIFLNAVILIGL